MLCQAVGWYRRKKRRGLPVISKKLTSRDVIFSGQNLAKTKPQIYHIIYHCGQKGYMHDRDLLKLNM